MAVYPHLNLSQYSNYEVTPLSKHRSDNEVTPHSSIGQTYKVSFILNILTRLTPL